MCADHNSTLVLASDRACPDCLTRVLASRVRVLEEALGDLVEAEATAFDMVGEATEDEAFESYQRVAQAVESGAKTLTDRTWWAPAYHADSPRMN